MSQFQESRINLSEFLSRHCFVEMPTPSKHFTEYHETWQTEPNFTHFQCRACKANFKSYARLRKHIKSDSCGPFSYSDEAFDEMLEKQISDELACKSIEFFRSITDENANILTFMDFYSKLSCEYAIKKTELDKDSWTLITDEALKSDIKLTNLRAVVQVCRFERGPVSKSGELNRIERLSDSSESSNSPEPSLTQDNNVSYVEDEKVKVSNLSEFDLFGYQSSESDQGSSVTSEPEVMSIRSGSLSPVKESTSSNEPDQTSSVEIVTSVNLVDDGKEGFSALLKTTEACEMSHSLKRKLRNDETKDDLKSDNPERITEIADPKIGRFDREMVQDSPSADKSKAPVGDITSHKEPEAVAEIKCSDEGSQSSSQESVNFVNEITNGSQEDEQQPSETASKSNSTIDCMSNSSCRSVTEVNGHENEKVHGQKKSPTITSHSAMLTNALNEYLGHLNRKSESYGYTNSIEANLSRIELSTKDHYSTQHSQRFNFHDNAMTGCKTNEFPNNSHLPWRSNFSFTTEETSSNASTFPDFHHIPPTAPNSPTALCDGYQQDLRPNNIHDLVFDPLDEQVVPNLNDCEVQNSEIFEELMQTVGNGNCSLETFESYSQPPIHFFDNPPVSSETESSLSLHNDNFLDFVESPVTMLSSSFTIADGSVPTSDPKTPGQLSTSSATSFSRKSPGNVVYSECGTPLMAGFIDEDTDDDVVEIRRGRQVSSVSTDEERFVVPAEPLITYDPNYETSLTNQTSSNTRIPVLNPSEIASSSKSSTRSSPTTPPGLSLLKRVRPKHRSGSNMLNRILPKVDLDNPMSPASPAVFTPSEDAVPFYCKICSIQLPNLLMYQMHRFQQHVKK